MGKHMKVTKLSPVTWQLNTLDINCTEDEYRAWRNGELIQNAMPNTPIDQREFLISGITPEEWEKVFGKS
jgi:hypothetical protein